jgi:hypothetical protein
MSRILCSVATRGRYDTTLPLTLMAIVNQSKLPDKLIVFDDNDNPKDLREELFYQHFFRICAEKRLEWEVVFAFKMGQHHIHQIANNMGYDWVWRVDDDCIPEPNVLERLSNYTLDDGVGAIGGSILTTQAGAQIPYDIPATGKIENIDLEPNIQWGYITKVKPVEHLHCSFLYRAGICDYHLGLSRVAHREETLFTYAMHKKYVNIVVPSANSWHLKNPAGGIRTEQKAEMFHHDETIFRNLMELKDKTIVVLDSGMGDHVVFSHVLPHIKNPEVFSCYPEIVPGRTIAEAQHLFGNLDQWNVYRKMIDWNWNDSLENAYRKLYL